MLILLDCRPLQYAGTGSERSRLIHSVVTALGREGSFQWLLVADHRCPEGAFAGLPGTLIRLRTLPGNTGWRFWYDWQLPRLARKHQAGLIMVTGRGAKRILPVPQCIWLAERPDSRDGPGIWLATRREETITEKVLVPPFPLASLSPLSLAEREGLKTEYARGREYFLADAAGAGEEGLIHLLKAFSLFKKRQLSNLQLVVMGVAADGLQKKGETYKYREDVHWCPPAADSSGRLTAGAYAVLLPFDHGSLGTPVLDAWKAGVPAIVKTGSPLAEWAADAVLSADGADPASLAARLMAVYKDEALRGGLITRGQSRIAEFGMERSVNAVRAVIERTSVIKA